MITSGRAGTPGPASIATDRAPSFTLPLRYFLLGIISYLLVTLGVVAIGPEMLYGTWQPHLLALVHLLTLGFFLSMIMGATYQLVPVVLLARVWSPALGKGTFWVHAAGVLGMVAGFWLLDFRVLAVGATLVVLGIVAFLGNVAASLLTGAQWSTVGAYLVAALAFLVLAGTLGFWRVLGFWSPALALGLPNVLEAHSHLAALGFVSLLIFGISYRLVSMFAITHGHERLERVILPVAAVGALGIGAGFLGSWAWLVRGGAVLAALAALLWASDVMRMYRGRSRRQLDTGLLYALTAVGYLVLAAILGVLLAWGLLPAGIPSVRWAIAYGLLALGGWVCFSIVGQFFKILPFLAWFHRYSKQVGKKKVPMIKDLYDERLSRRGLWASQIGLAGAVAAVLTGQGWAIQVAGGFLAVGAVTTAAMVVQSLTR